MTSRCLPWKHEWRYRVVGRVPFTRGDSVEVWEKFCTRCPKVKGRPTHLRDPKAL